MYYNRWRGSNTVIGCNTTDGVVATKLKDLLRGISSWKQLEGKISNLETVNERGEVFEEFCKAYFELNSVYQAKKVHRKIPPSFASKLGLHTTKDMGIDGVIETKYGEIYAYQSKFRRDRNDIPTFRELSTFYTISDKADYRFVITNADNLPNQINNRKKQGRITSGELNILDKGFFEKLRKKLLENKDITVEKLKPHQIQNEVITEGLKYFTNNDRGKLILPCGAGKTLAALWLTEQIEAKNILIMVPSLALMRQTLKEWSDQSEKEFRYMCLCSDSTVEKKIDSIIENTYEMDVRVSTDVDQVAKFLNQKTNIRTVLFSTYQSSKVLSKATLNTNTRFDIGILDEAHRTTGTKVGVWNTAIDDKKIPIKKRLFMTATPRIFAPYLKKKAKENDVILHSMDDPESYGETFYEMTFGKAISKNLITDYRIVVVGCSDPEVKKFIDKNKIILDDDKQWDSMALAKRIAVSKAINKYNLNKIFTFHNSVKGAKAFTTDYKHSVGRIYESMRFSSANNLECFHVNGMMNSGERQGIMSEFAESDIGIMSNARCLVEGVDIPTVDAIGFLDPKRSTIDIVQATGRALRKAK